MKTRDRGNSITRELASPELLMPPALPPLVSSSDARRAVAAAFNWHGLDRCWAIEDGRQGTYNLLGLVCDALRLGELQGPEGRGARGVRAESIRVPWALQYGPHSQVTQGNIVRTHCNMDAHPVIWSAHPDALTLALCTAVSAPLRRSFSHIVIAPHAPARWNASKHVGGRNYVPYEVKMRGL